MYAVTYPWIYVSGLRTMYRTNVASKCTFFSNLSNNISRSTNSLLYDKTTSTSCSSLPVRTASTYIHRPVNSCATKLTVSVSCQSIIIPVVPLRQLSRAINIALKRRHKKVSLPQTLRLIDEEGNNLGITSSDFATKLAESKNLKIVEVKKSSTSDTEAVYRLFTSKQQWEESKKKRKAAKSDPVNTTKDITIFSQIGEHDLEVKMSHLREFLTRGNCARVFISTKYRRGMNEQRERECRREMVARIESELGHLGEKVSENAHQRRGVVCLFRPHKK